MAISSMNITIDITNTTWAELRRFIRLADELGVADSDYVQVTWYDDGCEAVRELRIEGDQIAEASHRE